MSKLTNNQVGHFSQIDWSKIHMSFELLAFSQMYMFTSQERPIDQLGPFEELRILVVFKQFYLK
jgi:hypothetical protein